MTYEEKLDRMLENVRKDDIYTEENRKLILSFVETCQAKKLSAPRIIFYLAYLKSICKFHKKDFGKWTKEDVEILMRKVNEKGYKSWTLENYKMALKVFFRWLNNLDKCDATPKIVSWLVRSTPSNGLRREDLLTRPEIDRLIAATNNSRLMAIIATLSAGPRPAELFSIRIKDVCDEGGYIKVYVHTRKHQCAQERCIYIGLGFTKGLEEYVKEYLRCHPDKRNPEAALFPKLNNARLIYIVNLLAERAGIEKKLNPYRFRHSYGTWSYSNYEGSYARRLMGHSAGSKMESVYCHLSESDLVERLTGQKPMEQTEEIETITERRKKEQVTLFVMNKIWEARPELKAMAEDMAKKFEGEIKDMLKQ